MLLEVHWRFFVTSRPARNRFARLWGRKCIRDTPR
jgi:hypothetical protein